MSDFNNNAGGSNNDYQEKFIGDLRNRLIGQKLHGGSADPTLTPNWYENNLGFTVKTNVPDDQSKNDGKVRFGGDNNTSIGALTTLVKMIEGDTFINRGKSQDEDLFYSFTRVQPAWKDKPARELVRLTTGRKGGRYFIMLIEKDRPQPVFWFQPSDHHTMLINNEPASPVEQSGVYALSWATNIINAVPLLQREYYEKVGDLMKRWEEKKNNRGGGFKKGGFKKPYNGGGGGYQKNNNYQKPNNNYNQTPAPSGGDFDNSIPF